MLDPRWLFSGRKVLTVVVAIRRNATAFEYLEEYPVGILAELETQTGRKAPAGLFVVIMEYGRNFSGDDKDVFYYNRAVGEAQHAWQSNFLHPVIYYYKRLPTGKLSSLSVNYLIRAKWRERKAVENQSGCEARLECAANPSPLLPSHPSCEALAATV